MLPRIYRPQKASAQKSLIVDRTYPVLAKWQASTTKK